MNCGGIILCGGKSSRMGYPKAMLPFGPELMLQRVVRLLAEVVEPIAVVAAPEQQVPELPGEVSVIRDRREGRGPLEGLATGLEALGEEVESAYATSCDVPLLVPGFVQRMIELADGYDVAVPRVGKYHHPLAAVYRTKVLEAIERLLDEDRLRPIFLFDEVNTRVVAEEDLQDVDPDLHTLSNLNHPADYLAALQTCGFEAPASVVQQLHSAGDA